MKTYGNGENAPYGMYASFWPPDLRVVGADGEALDGREGLGYRRIPTLLAVALSPAIGGAFVLAFPIIVIAALVFAVGRWVWKTARRTAASQAHLAESRWMPQEAYLQRDDDGGSSPGEPAADQDLETLQAEVDARRQSESDD